MKLYYFYLKKALLLFLFISSCVPQAPQVQTLETSTIEIKENGFIENKCVSIKSFNETSLDLNSFLLVKDNESNKISYYQLSRNINVEIETNSESSILDSIISPNRQLVAFVLGSQSPLFETEKIIIHNVATSTPIKEFNWNLEWWLIAGWLNNSTLMILKEEDRQPYTHNPKSLITFDIYSGHTEEVNIDYPELNQLNYVNWNILNQVFSPDFTKVVYPSSKIDEGYINYANQWDIKNEKILAELPVALNATTMPMWSLDSKRVLITGLVSKIGESLNTWQSQELFVINENGQIEQLTNFSEFYDTPVEILNYVWSPNEKYIAFWLEIGRFQVPQLFIFDVDNKKAINNCISSAPYRDSSRIFWSPSSDMIAINYRRAKDDYFEPLLISISEKTALKMEENFYILGWLDSP